jgi:hypothetical protein
MALMIGISQKRTARLNWFGRAELMSGALLPGRIV